MSELRKSIAALCALVGTWGITAVADGVIDPVEWFGLLAVIGGTGAVWRIPNEHTHKMNVHTQRFDLPTELRASREDGHTDMMLVQAVCLVIITALLVGYALGYLPL